MSDIVRRRQIEERIVKTSQSVKVISKPQGDWLNDNEVNEFLDAWYELVQYYQEHEDTVLDIEVVREYVEFVQLLNRLKSDINLSDQRRNRAEEILEELEANMDEVVKEAVTNKYND